ncbi:TPA: hypothetical protein HH703_005233 [Escherichia coli]|nr:hypothetical protein [Escherichia coli]EFH9527258.1 hypothetical protein [Escherichia coli]HAH5420489.1 hypothetical protein [Escherichia coli]
MKKSATRPPGRRETTARNSKKAAQLRRVITMGYYSPAEILLHVLLFIPCRPRLPARAFLCTENPQLGWGFRKAFSFEPVIKTPFDLLKHLAVWQLQVSNKKSKGGPNGERKELSAHPMEL